LTLKGEKMSKSRGNIISVDDLINRYGVDGTRFMLISECEFGADADVSLKQFDARFNAQLADNLGNLVNRSLVMIKKYGISFCHSGISKKYPESIQKDKSILDSRLRGNDTAEGSNNSFSINIDSEIENLKFKEGVEKVFKKLTEANQKIDEKKPWELFKSGKQKELEDLFYNPLDGIIPIIFASAKALESFLPNISLEIIKQIDNLTPKVLFEKIKKS
jgi:methionyl-tRNA synthetase